MRANVRQYIAAAVWNTDAMKLSAVSLLLSFSHWATARLSCGKDGSDVSTEWSFTRVSYDQLEPILQLWVGQTFSCQSLGDPHAGVSFQLSLCNRTGPISKLENGKTEPMGEFKNAHFTGNVSKKIVEISYPADCAKKEKSYDVRVIVAYRADLAAAECNLLSQTGCQYVFLLQTPEFSAKGNVEPPATTAAVAATSKGDTVETTAVTIVPSETTMKGHISGGAAFFIVICLVVLCYFVLGALYKRLVLGAQGVEQIPHYLVFRRCCRRIQAWSDQLRGGERSAHESYRHYADDLSYDQPPLTVSVSTGGNDYNPVISHTHSRTPDEADERLIQP